MFDWEQFADLFLSDEKWLKTVLNVVPVLDVVFPALTRIPSNFLLF